MNEKWKDIPGFEGVYQASNLGRVKSFPHKINIPNKHCNNTAYSREKILKQRQTQDGYKQISLKGKTYKVHRLVLSAFSGKPLDYPLQVNHKDENVQNNNIENLEWCTPSYNVNYGNRNKKVSEKLGVRVKAVSSKGEIRYFKSQSEAGRVLGLRRNHISEIVNGKRETCNGWHFEKVVNE